MSELINRSYGVFYVIFSGKKGNMNLRLKKGTKFPVLDSSMATLIWMELGFWEEMEAIRKTLTKENLSAIEFTDDAGKVFGKYGNRCWAMERKVL